MKRLNLFCTMAMVVCLASFCSGQEERDKAKSLPSNQQHLTPLGYFIGDWELIGEIALAGQPKQPFVFVRHFQWDLGRNFIQTTMTETKGDKTELRHRSMIGWEAKAKCITEWGFWNSNLPTEAPTWAETVTWSQDGDKWHIEREGVDGLFTIIDQNTHTYECRFRGEDGSDNTWHYTAKRPSATATEAKQSVLPDEIVKELEYFVGNWTVEGIVLSKTLKGRWTAKWAPTRHCLLLTYPLSLEGEEVAGNGVMGWDTEKKEIVVHMFYTNGVLEHVRQSIESPGLLKGNLVGSAEGEPSKAACELRQVSPNEWTFQTKGHTVGGKDEGELSVRFTRSEMKPKKKQAK